MSWSHHFEFMEGHEDVDSVDIQSRVTLPNHVRVGDADEKARVLELLYKNWRRVMQYDGHVENGVIVLDEPAVLENGTRVKIELLPVAKDGQSLHPLRGTTYRYDAPFEPAEATDAWDAAR